MKSLSKREKVLQNIREAKSKHPGPIELSEPDLKAKIFVRREESLPETFAKEFNKINGRFIFCQNTDDFVDQFKQFIIANNWKNLFCTEEFLKPVINKTGIKYKKRLTSYTEAQVGITSCTALIARTGSIMVESGKDKSRTLSVFPPVHIVIAFPDNLFFDLKDAITYLTEYYGDKYPSMLSIISGPSRTADIEKTLVLGAHGPKELYCFYINEKPKR